MSQARAKPDFGSLDRIEWTPERVDYLRWMAEDENRSAASIAVDIGLSVNASQRIWEACKRFNIKLNGRSGRPRTGDATLYKVALAGPHAETLMRISKKHSIYPGRVLEMLLYAAFETGEMFCENLLDLQHEN